MHTIHRAQPAWSEAAPEVEVQHLSLETASEEDMYTRKVIIMRDIQY